MSMSEIADEVLKHPDRNTISSNKMITPSKKPASPFKSPDLNFTMPPEVLTLMEELEAEENQLQISETSSLSDQKIKPKLEEYQNFLGFTQKGIELTTTKKPRRANRTTTAQRNKRDKEIVVGDNN